MTTDQASTTFTDAYDAWIAYHRANGFEAERFLNPPATEQAIAGMEEDIGFTLPGDLKNLWRRADGQQDIFATDDPAPGAVISPFFGSYEFCSIAGALKEYRVWEDLRERDAETFERINAGIERRAGDPVHPDYWRPGWLPFALDGGGNAYAVDLSPPPGGTYGQVIVIGPDEDERRVLAPNIAEWVAAVAAGCPAIDDSQAEPPHAYFDMEG